MKIVYTKSNYPNGCPVCDPPIITDVVIFDEINSWSEFLLKVWNDRNDYKYSWIYSPDGELLAKITKIGGFHCIADVSMKLVSGVTYKLEDDGKGSKKVVEVYNM